MVAAAGANHLLSSDPTSAPSGFRCNRSEIFVSSATLPLLTQGSACCVRELLFVLTRIFAGTLAVVALVILAARFGPLMLVIVLTLAIIHYKSRRAHDSQH